MSSIERAGWIVGKGKVVLGCGSHTYSNVRLVMEALKAERGELKYVVERGASGADTHVKCSAIVLRIPYQQYDADWMLYGVSAEPIRNALMLEREPVDEVWAFVTRGNIWQSPGTLDMCTLALRKGISCRLYDDRSLNWRRLYWNGKEVEVEKV